MKSDLSFILDTWACLSPTVLAPLVVGSQVPEPWVRNPYHSSLQNGIAATQPPARSVFDRPGAAGPASCPPLSAVGLFPIWGKQSPLAPLGSYPGRWKSLGGAQVLLAVHMSAFAANHCSIFQAPLVRSHKPAPLLLHVVLFNICWRAPGDPKKQHDPMHWRVPAASLPWRHCQLSDKLLSTDKSKTPELI